MNIIKNFGPIRKVLLSVFPLKEFRKNIDRSHASGDLETERTNVLMATKTWGQIVTDDLAINVILNGEENLPEKGPVVYAANHQSYCDIPILCRVLTTLPFGFIAKNTLSSMPVYGRWMKRIRSVMIERNDPRESLKAIMAGIDNINEGFSMIIFPEGTRAKGGPVGEFKRGALKLASKPGVPIVPVTIDGSYRIYEETGVVTPTTVTVTIHPSFPTIGLSRKEENSLSDLVRETILSGLSESSPSNSESTD